MFQCCLIHIARPDASSILMENLGTHIINKQTPLLHGFRHLYHPWKTQKRLRFANINRSSHLKLWQLHHGSPPHKTPTKRLTTKRRLPPPSPWGRLTEFVPCWKSDPTMSYQPGVCNWGGSFLKTMEKTARWFLVWMSNTIFSWKLAKSGYFKLNM